MSGNILGLKWGVMASEFAIALEFLTFSIVHFNLNPCGGIGICQRWSPN